MGMPLIAWVNRALDVGSSTWRRLDGLGLENRNPGNWTVGSNPTPSAIQACLPQAPGYAGAELNTSAAYLEGPLFPKPAPNPIPLLLGGHT
jgi:hypothetical protein